MILFSIWRIYMSMGAINIVRLPDCKKIHFVLNFLKLHHYIYINEFPAILLHGIYNCHYGNSKFQITELITSTPPHYPIVQDKIIITTF